jgi:hypothetical protein
LFVTCYIRTLMYIRVVLEGYIMQICVSKRNIKLCYQRTTNLTQLIIHSEHLKQLHAGPQATLASVRQNYWPLSGRDAVRQVLFKCIKCFRARPTVQQPIMGNLPSKRVQPARPFINCGVDYAGPIVIKQSKGRGKNSIKAYVALFICLATKAIHLELVTDCSTETFLGALKRFIARRGMVSSIYSDNGTNFVGANRE